MGAAQVALLIALVSALIALVSALVASLSAYYSHQAVKQARISNGVAVLAHFLREFRELEPERRYVLRELKKFESSAATTGLSDLPEEARTSATRVAYYLDGLGLLVSNELVDEKQITTFLGGAIERQWQALRPFIEAERRARPEPSFQRSFEHLAELARRSDQGAQSANLLRWTAR